MSSLWLIIHLAAQINPPLLKGGKMRTPHRKSLFATFANVITLTGLKKSRRFRLFPAFLLHKKTKEKNRDEKLG